MPALVNMQVLEEIADPDYQTELGAYNIELNVPPRRLPDLQLLEADLRTSLNAAEKKANVVGAQHRHGRDPADGDAGAPAAARTG